MRITIAGLLASLLTLFVAPAPFAQPTEQPETKKFFLPSNPVAAAYVLGRLSNQELIAAPRSEFVFVALLQRAGLEKKYRIEALDGLAKLRQTNRLTELIKAVRELDKKGAAASTTVRDLGTLFQPFERAELIKHRNTLDSLSKEAELRPVRETAYAAMVAADGSIDPVWKKAEMEPTRWADLINAIPLIRDPKTRSDLYPKVEPLLSRDDQPELQRAAMTAITAMPGHESKAFEALAQFVESGKASLGAIASLQRIPKKSWPKERVEPLLLTLVAHLEKTAAGERTRPEMVEAVQFATDLATVLPPEQAKSINKKLREFGVRVVMLRTIYEQMLFDRQQIVVEAGKPVEIVFENDDAMPHNLAIVMPGAVEEIGTAAEKMPPEPDAQGRLHIPDSPKVLWATRLLAPGEKTKLSFIAPAEAREYPYLCTYPGHWRRMVGALIVVNDLEAYLANQPVPVEPQMTEWKLSDLAPDLAKVSSGRNLQNGKQLATSLACLQCHKIGSDGYSYGPDLTEVFKRWKGDHANVLQQILEPSQVMEPRYRSFLFETTAGDSLFGMVLKEDSDIVTIQTGPAETLLQTIRKSEIKQRQPQASSPMPVGLLNSLNKEQIFDLLAFLEAGGKVQLHEHKH